MENSASQCCTTISQSAAVTTAGRATAQLTQPSATADPGVALRQRRVKGEQREELGGKWVSHQWASYLRGKKERKQSEANFFLVVNTTVDRLVKLRDN